MSDAVAIDNPTVADEGQSSAWRQRLAVLDKWLEAAGDRLNPILVKETRQAIKSKQFAITFVLLLMLCWIVTIGGLTLLGPGVYYSAAGGELLKAYMFLLLFPLAVVVPFSAFRSLSSEREENTYDLLRVSTLSPHQIVRGKLGSAAVQMGVYLSAVAPCIAFTYLLRGVDVVTIAVMLLYATLGSLGLAMTSLFMAALAQGKHGQVLLSVGVVTMLLGSFAGSAGLAIAYLDEGRYEVSREELRIFSAGALTFYLTTFALLYLAAVALISYRSENRSTSLRWAMIVQQAAFIGWMAWAWLRFNYEPEGLIVALIIGAIYWYAMGTMLTSESPELSNRVRRRLPQSSMGRLVRGLLNPGPGTGYLFAVACFTGLCLMACAALVYVQYIPLSQRRNYQYPEIIGGMILLWCYLVTYLGVGKLIIAGINRLVPVNAIAGFLLHVIFLMAGAGIPLVIQLSLRSMRNAGYTALQLSNPFWTLGELLEGGGFSDKEIILQSIVLGAVAVCILMVNMPGTAREFMQGRVALPQRVAQDEAELHPVEIKPQNPWEEEAEAAADPDGTEA